MKLLFVLLSIVSVMDTTICKDSTITMTSTYEKTYYRWSNATTGEEISTNRSILFTPDAIGEYQFTCEPYNDSIELHDAMEGANGDFENDYTGFVSDFLPITKNNVPVINPTAIYSGKYDNGDWDQSSKKSGAKGYYMITNNAQTLQSDASIFKPIKPHGGNEFLLVDAFADGYAWKVEDIAVAPGMTYDFSYWTTTPNARAYELQFKAKLQFIITYKDQYGFETEDKLGDPYEVGTEAGNAKWEWHQNKVSWTAPADATTVTIGVKNLTIEADGNDFCLDDIVFMPQGEPQSAIVETFRVVVEDCTPEPEPEPECVNLIYTKWNDVLVVNNDQDTLATYQWYRDGILLEGATLQYYRETEGVEGHTYSVKGLTISNKPYEACEVAFAQADRSQTLVDASKVVMTVRRHYVGTHLEIREMIYEDGSREVIKVLQ